MRKGYGENIAWNSSYSESAIGVVDRWCSEKNILILAHVYVMEVGIYAGITLK